MKKLIVPLLLMSVFVTGCGTDKQGSLEISNQVDFGEEDYQKIVSANNQLGMDLLSVVEANEDGNTFISPTSLFMALSMVYNGADGKTKDEIAKVLQVEGIDVAELNQANASLMSLLHSDSKKIQLNVANSIWLNNQFHFQTDFAKKTRDYFNAKIQEMDILDRQSPEMINDWVKQATNGKIEEMVEAPLDSNIVAILLNAIYFKGGWTYGFDKKQTEQRAFHLKDGTTKNLPLMTLNKELAYTDNASFQAVSLPYGDGEMSMNVFLPKENTSLEEFEKLLTNENWKNWMSEFHERKGTIMLPTFQMEYEVKLNETLKKLGMNSAFERDANFTKMITEEEPLSISEVKQKTYLDVNEEGTEAAAVTSVEVVAVSAPVDKPFQMEVNRPFFIAITDDETGTILFMGSISNPQEGK
ncbi:serpin family protein [Peribacillus sp. NPDC096379]|uniref:serpin family protein n=1 Tax=Peribacillus sp. NPDC096379 TaxID=3364393 RepID=UPI0037FCFD22